MRKRIVFYDKAGNEQTAYTETGTFAGERKETAAHLAYERNIPVEEITIKEEMRCNTAKS